jgi:WD40 repeat protein
MLAERFTLPGFVMSFSLSPDGRFLARGSNDGVVSLWDLQSDRKPQRAFAADPP